MPYATVDRWWQIQGRIDTAAVLIAEVTQYTPNLVLQIGYALGRGCPVLLISQAELDEPFTDLPSITYASSRDLESGIKAHLDDLKAVGKY